jgi:DNA gyrase/topoisomerase IV subunit B
MDELAPRPIAEISTIEAVRKRPLMYVGSTAFFGFINYLVCPVSLLLGQSPTRIAIAAADGGFVVESDVAIPIEETSSGGFAPFEEISNFGPGHGFEGTVLNGLSERLTVEIRHEHRTQTLTFRRGARESHQAATGQSHGPKTTLTFAPDTSIFTVTALSPAIFRSYLRRLSFLHRGVRFSIDMGGETQEFHAERGIVDLFDSVSASYQILHEPIHIVAEEGTLHLETVFAYHSWKENGLWCFINNGRAVEGGTHEKGLHDALDQFYRKFKPPKSQKTHRNGVVGIMSIRYPDAVWEGCIKARIGNPELREMVCNLVVQGAAEWLTSRPEVAGQLRNLETFQFPEAWST